MKPVVGKKYRSLWGVRDLWTVTDVGVNVLLLQDVAEEGWDRATRGCPLHLFEQHYEEYD